MSVIVIKLLIFTLQYVYSMCNIIIYKLTGTK